MNVTFKTCTSNPKTAEKSFSGAGIVVQNVQPFERLDDLTGTLILGYDATIEACNYCEFEGMKYFITGKARDIGNRLVLTLRLDALSSYWNQIKKCPAVVRTTTDTDGWSRYMQGNRLVQSYNVTHAAQGAFSNLDFDSTHLFMGIYG